MHTLVFVGASIVIKHVVAAVELLTRAGEIIAVTLPAGEVLVEQVLSGEGETIVWFWKGRINIAGLDATTAVTPIDVKHVHGNLVISSSLHVEMLGFLRHFDGRGVHPWGVFKQSCYILSVHALFHGSVAFVGSR